VAPIVSDARPMPAEGWRSIPGTDRRGRSDRVSPARAQHLLASRQSAPGERVATVLHRDSRNAYARGIYWPRRGDVNQPPADARPTTRRRLRAARRAAPSPPRAVDRDTLALLSELPSW